MKGIGHYAHLDDVVVHLCTDFLVEFLLFPLDQGFVNAHCPVPVRDDLVFHLDSRSSFGYHVVIVGIVTVIVNGYVLWVLFVREALCQLGVIIVREFVVALLFKIPLLF